jgi:hypothetical protein
MSLAGDFLREIRGRLGFARSRRKFLDETNLPWDEETLRSLEDGTNLITSDHIRDMVSAGIFEKDDVDYKTMVDAAKKDAAFRAQAKERLKQVRELANLEDYEEIPEIEEGGDEGIGQDEEIKKWFDYYMERVDIYLNKCNEFLASDTLSKSENPEIRDLAFAVHCLCATMPYMQKFLTFAFDREAHDEMIREIRAKYAEENADLTTPKT